MDEVRDHVGSDAERIASLEATVDELRSLVQRQGAVLAKLEGDRSSQADPTRSAVTEAPTAAASEPAGASPDAGPTWSRRRLLVGGGAAAAATAAALVATAEPAAANGQGQSWTLGGSNTATAITSLSAGLDNSAIAKLTNTSTIGSGLIAQSGTTAGLAATGAIIGDSHDRDGVVGLSASKFGVRGRHGTFTGDVPATSGGVWGESDNGHGVVGLSNLSSGVTGGSKSGSGVAGASTSSFGVAGVSKTSAGVAGQSEASIGLYGLSDTGPGLRSESTDGPAAVFASHYAQIVLQPGDTFRNAPTTDTVAHTAGELVFDSGNVLWFCIASGTPGTWRQLSASDAAGTFHVNPSPVRVYDSRAGTSPSTGPKTPLGAGEQRTVALTPGAPKGATAAMVTCLLVNTSSGNGNFTIWKAGTAKPASNSLVWGGSTGRFTVTAASALNADAKVLVSSSLQTDIVLDVVGYYR